MNVQYIRTGCAIAIAGAFLWAASAFGGGSAPDDRSAWKDMNAEIEAWLAGRAAEAHAAETATDAAPEARMQAEAAAPAPAAASAPADRVPSVSAPAAEAPLAGSAAGVVDLNRATIEELDALPGIGRVKAQAVIDYRETQGPFARPEDILNVKGIGPAIFEKIKTSIVAGPVASNGK